jgi:hypothetical protein
MLDLLADIHFHYADQAEDPDIKLAYELAGVQLNKKKFN